MQSKLKLAKVDGDTLSVGPGTTLPARSGDSKHPKVRRWDHFATDAISLADDNALPIQESPVWIDLEDGVQIQFSSGGEYRTGDYWLIPARVATGNIEWPQDGDLNPQPLPPHGVEHHYAPLGFVEFSGGAVKSIQPDCLCKFYPLNDCEGYYSLIAPAPAPPAPRPTPFPAPPVPHPSPFTVRPLDRPAAPRRPKVSKARKRPAKKHPRPPAGDKP